MAIELFRSTWGIDAPWEVIFPQIFTQGYRGVELGVPLEAHEQTRLRTALQDHHLDYIAIVFSSGDTLAEHVTSSTNQIMAAIACGARQITLHGWRDSSSFTDGCAYIEAILTLEQRLGIAIAHETHRGRLLYNPWNTDAYLQRYPTMHICADYSHWVVVAERLLTDAEAIFARCAAHAIHVHTRVGHAQGPQVADPSLPRYAAEHAAHEHWWQLIVAAHAQQARPLTMTPEYGPPAYQATDIATNLPLRPLTEIVAWQTARLRTLFDVR